MTTELVFQEVNRTAAIKRREGPQPYVRIRRPAEHTLDGFYTIGKIRPQYAPRTFRDPFKLIGWRLELNGSDTLSFEELAEVYLAMSAMMERVDATTTG